MKNIGLFLYYTHIFKKNCQFEPGISQFKARKKGDFCFLVWDSFSKDFLGNRELVQNSEPAKQWTKAASFLCA